MYLGHNIISFMLLGQKFIYFSLLHTLANYCRGYVLDLKCFLPNGAYVRKVKCPFTYMVRPFIYTLVDRISSDHTNERCVVLWMAEGSGITIYKV